MEGLTPLVIGILIGVILIVTWVVAQFVERYSRKDAGETTTVLRESYNLERDKTDNLRDELVTLRSTNYRLENDLKDCREYIQQVEIALDECQSINGE